VCGREIALKYTLSLWGLGEWPRWLLDIFPLSLPIEMWHRTKMKSEVHVDEMKVKTERKSKDSEMR
jgi:hypothetical protein